MISLDDLHELCRLRQTENPGNITFSWVFLVFSRVFAATFLSIRKIFFPPEKHFFLIMLTTNANGYRSILETIRSSSRLVCSSGACSISSRSWSTGSPCRE